MQPSDNPRENFLEFAWDAAANIIYLSGVALIELGIRPLFENRGVPVPILANWILTTAELLLLLTLLRKLLNKIDEFIREFVRSWTVQSVAERIRTRTDGESTNDTLNEERTSPQPDGSQTKDHQHLETPTTTEKKVETNDEK